MSTPWTISGGSGTVTTDDITDATSAGKTLLKAANAGAQRTAMGLGTSATTAAVSDSEKAMLAEALS